MRPAGRIARAYARVSATRPGRWFSRRVAWKLDPYLLRLTRGRVSLSLMLPTGLLETTGARTGEPRRNAVIYLRDGERVVIFASLAGAAHHPAWFHNLRAHPDVRFAGVPMRAEIVADATERDRLWRLADQVFPPFATYRREAAAAGREIPVVRLESRR